MHERHIPILLFSAAVFLVMGILKLRQGRLMSVPPFPFSAGRGYSGAFGLAVFAIALVGMSAASGIAVRFSQFAYTDSLSGAAVPSQGAANTPLSGMAVDPAAAISDPASAVGLSGMPTPAGAEPTMPASDGGIVMGDDNFAQWLTELYTKPDAWIGKKITATGSVWKDGELFEQG